MEIIRALVLGIVQGITEFLPISSDGHLLLVRHIFGWADEGLSFDAALHLGTFFAVLVYFRATWITLLRGRDMQLFWALLVGTVPAGLVGLLSERLIAGEFRSLLVTGVSFIGTAALLFVASRRERPSEQQAFTPRRGFFVGCVQIIALLPGLSRSGATMTAGMLTGLSRERAVEFSFLLALPITAAAGLEGVRGTLHTGFSPALGIGMVAAFLSGLGAIRFLLHYVRTRAFTPFILYLLVLGVLVTAWSVL